MATVNALRLSQNSGGIISDEETWLFGRRRLFISDSISSLLTPEQSALLSMEVVFAGVGSISLTHEVFRNVRHHINAAFEADLQASAFPWPSVDALATLCHREFQAAIRRRINAILRMRYGFDLASFQRGYFEKNSQKIEIRQKRVIEDCLALIEPSGEVSAFLKPVFDNEALVAGYDKVNGFQIYELDARSQEKFLAPSAYCNLGRGADVGSIALADMINRRTLQERRQGIEKIEGIIELIHSANMTSQFNNQVGGYFTIIILDGDQADRNLRFQEIMDHEARLASEIVTVLKAGLLSPSAARVLIEKILQRQTLAEIEQEFFASVANRRHLDLVLRGYKTGSINESYLHSERPYRIFEAGMGTSGAVDTVPAGLPREEVQS